MKSFDELTFTDHYMFEKVLQDPGICKDVLERLLKIQIEKLVYPEIEKTISPFYETKGVRLDVYVKGSDKVFDIELQNAEQTDLPLRTRYYQSMIDTDTLLKGNHYSKMPESFILFICTYDPFGKDLPIYTFLNRCEEQPSLKLEDKAIKKIFNAKAYEKEKDVAIKAFLQYISKQEAVDDLTDRIDALVANIKRIEANRREYAIMNIHDQETFLRGKEEGIAEGRAEGIAEGLQQGEAKGRADGEYQNKIATAKNALAMKLPIEQIMLLTGLSQETIQQLARSR